MEELGGRGAVVFAVGTLALEHDDAIGIGEVGRLEQNGVDDGEDGGVGADAKCERGDGGGGESATLPEHAEGVAEVLEECFH